MAFSWNGDELMSKLRQGVANAIFKTTEAVRNEAVRSILQGQKSGRIYRRRGIEHKASAPGEAPASDTGRLANSIDTSYEDRGLTGIVHVRAEYAPFLEFGTIKMEPRPFMRPALDSQREQLNANIADELRKVLAA